MARARTVSMPKVSYKAPSGALKVPKIPSMKTPTFKSSGLTGIVRNMKLV